MIISAAQECEATSTYSKIDAQNDPLRGERTREKRRELNAQNDVSLSFYNSISPKFVLFLNSV